MDSHFSLNTSGSSSFKNSDPTSRVELLRSPISNLDCESSPTSTEKLTHPTTIKEEKEIDLSLQICGFISNASEGEQLPHIGFQSASTSTSESTESSDPESPEPGHSYNNDTEEKRDPDFNIKTCTPDYSASDYSEPEYSHKNDTEEKRDPDFSIKICNPKSHDNSDNTYYFELPEPHDNSGDIYYLELPEPHDNSDHVYYFELPESTPLHVKYESEPISISQLTHPPIREVVKEEAPLDLSLKNYSLEPSKYTDITSCFKLPGSSLVHLECESSSTSTSAYTPPIKRAKKSSPNPLLDQSRSSSSRENSVTPKSSEPGTSYPDYQSASTSRENLTHHTTTGVEEKTSHSRLSISDEDNLDILWEKSKRNLKIALYKTFKKFPHLEREELYECAMKGNVRFSLGYFLRDIVAYIDKYLTCVENMADLKIFNSNLNTELSLRFYPLIGTSYLKITGENGSKKIIEKKMWNDPLRKDIRLFGEDELLKICSFDKIFFHLTRKNNLSEDDLSRFQSENNSFANWDLFSPCFLGRILSRFQPDEKASQLNLSLLNLIRLVLFRYIKLISCMMLINKALNLPIKWIDYKRFVIAKTYDIQIRSGIELITNGDDLPTNFWIEFSYLSQWIIDYKKSDSFKPEQIGKKSEKKEHTLPRYAFPTYL